MDNHNYDNKIAIINDFTGFGRCSIAVSVPIISMLKVQCCMLPTSVFSNHTAFDSYYFNDYTKHMQPSIDEWKKLNLEFAGIYTGFLGSAKQIEIVKGFINDFKAENTHVIVDPVMGDNGKAYPTYTDKMCQKMKELVSLADIITPNLTEACILTDTPYSDGHFSNADIQEMAHKLSKLGPTKIVITGISQGQFVANYCYDANASGACRYIKTHKIGSSRAGTGDIFSSIIAADAINNVPFDASVKKASLFIKKCIKKSEELNIPTSDGVCFEQFLHTLK